MIKIKKGIPLYDQCDDNGYWGKIFGEKQDSFMKKVLSIPIIQKLSLLIEITQD